VALNSVDLLYRGETGFAYSSHGLQENALQDANKSGFSYRQRVLTQTKPQKTVGSERQEEAALCMRFIKERKLVGLPSKCFTAQTSN
jgi:hypothetical protein